MTDWIIAPILLPALTAAGMVTALRGRLGLQRLVSVASVLGLNALAVALLWSVTVNGPQAYYLGDWPAPFGIVLMLDRQSALMVALLAVLALPVVVHAIGSGWDRQGAHFHPLVQFLLMGIAGAFLTGDAFNLFVFFEVLLIASYGLMVHGGGKARLRAGITYVAFNLLGSALFLIALGLLYAVTGTLNMADLAQRLPALPAADTALLRVAAVLLLAVFAIKGALVPLQFWLPGTYAQAPGVVAALFAIMTKVGAYAALRFGTLVFPPDLSATGPLYADLIFGAALGTVALGSIGVLGAQGLPRLAAFAAISSMGTAFLAISAFTPAGTAAGMYYILHSTLATALMFLVVDLVTRGEDGPRRQPGIAAALYLAGAIALAGLPPLSGFVGKLSVLQAWRDQAPLVWTTVLLGSFAMILGLARTGSQVMWAPHATPSRKPGLLELAPALGLALALVALTVLAGPVTRWIGLTADSLHDPQAYIAATLLGKG